MRVCDYCHQAQPIRNVVKINGKEFELCADCSQALKEKIEGGAREPSKIERLFGG